MRRRFWREGCRFLPGRPRYLWGADAARRSLCCPIMFASFSKFFLISADASKQEHCPDGLARIAHYFCLHRLTRLFLVRLSRCFWRPERASKWSFPRRRRLRFSSARNPPALFVLDATLPDVPIGQLLAAARAIRDGPRVPIALVAESVAQEWIDRLADGVIDDLILRSAEPAYWQLRIDLLLRSQRLATSWKHSAKPQFEMHSSIASPAFTTGRRCSPCCSARPTARSA